MSADIARSVVATGKVQPITKVELKSKASGIVTRLDTDINAHVKQGQVLAQLDQQEILAQVAAQKAQLNAAESNAHAAAAAIQYDKVSAEAPDLPMYKNTYDRNAAMSKQGVLSQQSLDDAQQKYRLIGTSLAARPKIGSPTARSAWANIPALPSWRTSNSSTGSTPNSS